MSTGNTSHGGLGDDFDPSMLQDDNEQDASVTTEVHVPVKYTGKPSTNFTNKTNTGNTGFAGGGNNYGGYSGNVGANMGGGLPTDRYTDTRIAAEEHRYREHTSLSVWLIKFVTVAISIIIITLLMFFGYVTVVNKSLPDMSVFGQFFGGLVQVVNTVFSLGTK